MNFDEAIGIIEEAVQVLKAGLIERDARVKALTTHNEELGRDVTKYKDRLTAAEADYHDSLQRNEGLYREQRASYERDVANLRERAGRLEDELEDTKRRLRLADEELTAAKRWQEELQTDHANLNDRIDQLTDERDEAVSKADETLAQLNEARIQLRESAGHGDS